tara:strand:- start:1138 stop:1287 length:150 start_codon:yes stop_codon:yes gene_type:complete
MASHNCRYGYVLDTQRLVTEIAFDENRSNDFLENILLDLSHKKKVQALW